MNTSNHNDVVVKFDAIAEQYDRQRRKLIPCFDDFYGTAVLLAESEDSSLSILDLGAGTGLLSAMILRKYPNANLTLIDLSEKMIDVARTRLQDARNVQYVIGDYTNLEDAGKYDMIVSALSIHHLEDEDKRLLFRNTYRNLKTGGVFVNADQVLGHTVNIDALYKTDWKKKIEATDLTSDELAAAYERTKLDKMAPLSAQMGWLEDAGFADVDCVYKYHNFAVMYARKPENE